MTDAQVEFYKREKAKFDQLLRQLNWTEDCLLQELRIQCPLDRGHRFPGGSQHLQRCQLNSEVFSRDCLKELAASKQENELLGQASISMTPSTLSELLGRQLPIKTDLPLNVEQTSILLTPSERLTVGQAVHREALHRGILPITPSLFAEPSSSRSADPDRSQVAQPQAQSRDQKRRRAKYVTRPKGKSFYDTARELIASQMELLQQTEENQPQAKASKDKHRSSSKKKHKSRRSSSDDHRRHSKKRRRS